MDTSLFKYTHYMPLCRNCSPAFNKWLDMARSLFLESYDNSQIKGQGLQLLELEEKDFLQGDTEEDADYKYRDTCREEQNAEDLPQFPGACPRIRSDGAQC